MTSVEASVIIVNYNCKEIVGCINSVKKCDYPKSKFEIIVVDNKSSDNSLNMVKRKFPDVRVIKLDKNYGFGAGCNRGAEHARGRYLIFLNPDSIVDKGWLESLIKVVKSNKNAGTVTSKILYFSTNKINSLGCFLSTFGICGSIAAEKFVKSNGTKFNVFAPAGTSFIISKYLFQKISGFDERLFLYAEDVDLGWRVLNEGYENIMTSDSVVYHKTSTSSREKPPYFHFYNTRNSLLIIIKNATFLHLLSMMTFSTIFHISRSVVFAMMGRWKQSYATIKGVLWVLLNLANALRMRNAQKSGYSKYVSGFKDSIPILFNKISKHLR